MVSPTMRRITFCWLLALCAGVVSAAELPTEADYYPITKLPIPQDAYLEVGGLELLADGRLAVSTRRGEVYLVTNPQSQNLAEVRFQRFAQGMHEVLGLAEYDGQLYATQRGEVTRLIDEDGDGRADLHETVTDQWGINGDYHEYAFNSKFDREGKMWVVLCLTGSGSANSDFRGWCMRVSPDGTTTPTASGIRSPGGVGMNAEGDVFYTDNQGPWNGTCSLKWLRPGSFQGNPTGNKYYELTDAIGPRPKDPQSGSRMMVEAKKIPEFEPSAVLFPYDKMGKSASGIACDTSGGKFGPFANQLFVADHSHSTVMRVFLEKINGHYQGVCFPFLEGFAAGSLALQMTPEGSLFVGGTSRGWGTRGTEPFSLERLQWTGKMPFEVQEMRAKPDGFELTFTRPVDPKTAADVKSYTIGTYTYIYQANYDSPEVDRTTPTITRIEVAQDNRSARLYLDKLQEGHVHELHLPGIRSADGLPLLHNVAYYTLNYIPQ